MKSILERRELIDRLKGIMLVRLLLISMFLGIGPFVLGLVTRPFFIIIGFLYFATLIYSLLLRSKLNLKIQAYGQFFIDVVIETALLSFTGGIDSGFVLLYVLSIVSASIVIGSGAGIIIAVSSSCMYAFLGVCECLGFQPFAMGHPVSTPCDPVYVVYFIFVRGTIFGVLGFLGDYFAKSLKRNKLELARYRKLNERILMQMKSGLMTTDDYGSVIYANRAAEEILGYGREEMIGKSWHLFLGPPVADINAQWLSDKAESFTRCEIEVRRKDGRMVPVGFTISSIIDREEVAIGLLIMFRDLTQIHRMEERMRRADRLSAAGAILASVAHEVRNPLASIRGAVEMLSENGSFIGDNKRFMDVIIKESDRLNRIVCDFLLYSDGSKAERTREDLGALLDEVISLVKEGKKLKSGARLAREDNGEPMFVRVDACQLKQVFINILENALEAIPSGGMITVSLERGSSIIDGKAVARVRFADTGEGMDVERMSHLFEPFYSTKATGNGMGLFIAERIVRNHGGQLEVESREGRGTVFSVTLPCEQDEFKG